VCVHHLSAALTKATCNWCSARLH